MANHLFALPDGRNLGVSAAGDPIAMRLVLLCHPAPGTGGFDPDPSVTTRWGVHLMSLDRPGYGASDPLPAGVAPRLIDRARDLAAYIRDAERTAHSSEGADYGRIGLVGWGYGALVAAAIASHLPDIVDRVALIDPIDPSAELPDTSAPFSLADLGIADDPTPMPAADQDQSARDADPGREKPLEIPDTGAEDRRKYAHIGLRNRLQEMLSDAAAHGTTGFETDRAALKNLDPAELAFDVKTLVLSSAHGGGVRDEDQETSSERTRAALRAMGIRHRVEEVDGEFRLAIVDGWQQILEHVAPKHGHIPGSERR